MNSQIGFFEDNVERIRLVDGEMLFWPYFLQGEHADQLLETLYRELAWEQSTIQMYGKPISIPRLNAWYADHGCDYQYSGYAMPRYDWHPLLNELRTSIESKTGHEFNSVLANCYRDGNDSVGWHSDDEPELGRNPVIASLSLGATRKFSLKHRKKQDLPNQHVPLTHGSLLLMTGETQHHWHHAIPKTKRVDTMRINLTFRKIIQ